MLCRNKTIIVIAVLVVLLYCYRNRVEGFSNIAQYGTWMDNVQSTPDGQSFVNVKGPGCNNLVIEKPWGCNYVSRPTYSAEYEPKMHADGLTNKIKGAFPSNDKLATNQKNWVGYTDSSSVARPSSFSSYLDQSQAQNDTGYLRAKELASVACNNEPTALRVQKTDGQSYNKVEECRTNLPAASLESLKFGRDPRNPQTFMYDRLIFANKKRRNWEGSDLIRGDVPIMPDNRGWFQVNVHANLDLRKGALQHISDCGQRCNKTAHGQIGRDISTTVDGQDVQMMNKEQQLGQMLQQSRRDDLAISGAKLL